MINLGVLRAVLSLRDEMSPQFLSAVSKLQRTGQQMRSIGAGLTVGVLLPIAAVGIAAVKMASDAEEAANKFNVVMGPAADRVRAELQKLTETIPLTRSQMEGMTAGIQDMLVPMGVARAEAANMSLQMVGLAGDLGSLSGVGTDEVLMAMQSALAGSSEPMRRFGVDTREAALKAIALQAGLLSAGQEMNQTARAQAVLLAIQKDSTDAMGAAASGAGLIANLMRFLKRDVLQLGISLGQVLIPIVRPLLIHLREWVGWLRQLDPQTQKWIVLLGGVAAAAGPVLVVMGLLVTTVSGVTAGFSRLTMAMVANAAAAKANAAANAANNAVFIVSQSRLGSFVHLLPNFMTKTIQGRNAMGQLTKGVRVFNKEFFTAPGRIARFSGVFASMGKSVARIVPLLGRGLVAALGAATVKVVGTVAAGFKLGNVLSNLAVAYRSEADAIDKAIQKQGLFKAGLSLIPDILARVGQGLKSIASSTFDLAKSLVPDTLIQFGQTLKLLFGDVFIGGLIDFFQTKFQKLADTLFNVKRNAEGLVDASLIPLSAQDLRLLEKARELLGQVFAQTPEGLEKAIEAMNAHNEGLRTSKEALQQQAANLRQSVAAMLDAKEKTELLARASSLAGVKIEDQAKALEVLRHAAARAASEDIGKLVVSLGTSDIQAEAQKYVSALQQIQDSGKSLSLEGLDSVSGAIAKLESEGLGPLAKTIRELIPDSALLAKGQRDAAAAAAEHAQRAQSLATSLGTAGLRGQMESMSGALLLVLESGDRLSEQGFSQLSSMIEELEANGLHIPPLFEAMRDEFLATDIIVNQATNRFLDLKAILPAVATGIDRASQAQKDAAKTASAYELALAQVAGQMGGSVGQVANMTIAMLEHNRTLGDGEKAFSKAQIGSALMASAFAAAGDAIGGTAGEILTSASSIAAAFATGGVVGAAIAGIGEGIKWLGKLFKPKWKKLGEEGARLFGKAFSEELSRELVKSQKALGSLQNAMAANIGTIVEEVGVTAENLDQTMRSVHILIGMVENGTLDWKDAVGQLDKAFDPVMEHLIAMGTEGVFQLGRLIERMRELGNVSAEAQAFVQEKAKSAVEAMTVYFENLAKEEELTAERAQEMVGVVATAFQAAIAAGGGLLGAVQQLGPAFGEVLQKLRGVLGDDNPLLNQVSQFYNFVSNNQEQLSAIASLGTAFKELASIGLINAANIGDFAGTFKAEFDKILGSTEDQTAALAAMGPQIGLLLESYRELGMQVPPWLEEMAGKAKEAGANLTPPEDTIDIFRDIRDMLGELVDALKGVGEEARRAGAAMGDLDQGRRPHMPRFDDGIPGAAHEAFVPHRPGGHLFRVGEGAENEFILKESTVRALARGGRGALADDGFGGGGSRTINVTNQFVLDGAVIGTTKELAEAFAPVVTRALRDDPNVQREVKRITE